MQHVFVVARQVLIVLGKELRVLEGDNLAGDGFDDRRGIADAGHLSRDVIDLYEVAYLDATGHERDAVVDVLDDVLRCETDTSRETAGNDGEPRHGDIQDAHGNQEPSAPHQHLQHVLSHHLAAGGGVSVFGLIVHAQQFQQRAVDVAEEEPQIDHHGNGDDAQLQVLQIDKVGAEYLPAEVGEVEDFRCPVDADHHRCHAQHGQQHLVAEVVEPRLRHGTLVEAVALAIEFQVTAHAGDGQDARKLHDPPDEYLY